MSSYSASAACSPVPNVGLCFQHISPLMVGPLVLDMVCIAWAGNIHLQPRADMFRCRRHAATATTSMATESAPPDMRVPCVGWRSHLRGGRQAGHHMHNVDGITLPAQVLYSPCQRRSRLGRQRHSHHHLPGRLLPCKWDSGLISCTRCPCTRNVRGVSMRMCSPGMRLHRSCSLPSFSEGCRCRLKEGKLLICAAICGAAGVQTTGIAKLRAIR